MSSALLIAYTFGYFKVTTFPSFLRDPTLAFFTFRASPSSSVDFLPSGLPPSTRVSPIPLVSGGIVDRLDTQNKPHIPKPDSWRTDQLPTCMLMSPQAFLQGEYMEAIKTKATLPNIEDHFRIYIATEWNGMRMTN